jgi:fructokinase
MLLSCGDAVIDFLPVKSADGRDALVPVVGGSCRMIADHATASGVDLRYATRSGHQSTLAFVRSVAGESQYAFYDADSASRNWRYRSGSIPFREIDAIHVGSTTLVDDAGAAQAFAMVQEAQGSTTISFDPNCRPNLVTDKVSYATRMAAFAAAADIVRMSDLDFEYLYGDADYADRAKSLIAAGASLVVVTRGVRGVQAWHREAGVLEVEAPEVSVADTIGAGDSFQAALLFALHALGRIGTEPLQETSADQLRRALSFASACAAITVGRVGADPPRRAELGAEVFEMLLKN